MNVRGGRELQSVAKKRVGKKGGENHERRGTRNDFFVWPTNETRSVKSEKKKPISPDSSNFSNNRPGWEGVARSLARGFIVRWPPVESPIVHRQLGRFFFLLFRIAGKLEIYEGDYTGDDRTGWGGRGRGGIDSFDTIKRPLVIPSVIQRSDQTWRRAISASLFLASSSDRG